MEKLVYALWKPPEQPDAAFASRLLGELAPRLVSQGARQLEVSVVDADVEAGARLRLSAVEPAKSALVGFWLEQSQERGPLEAELAAAAARSAGYLVVESRPLVNTTRRAPPGERTPGFSLVTGIVPRAGLDQAEFIRRWCEIQRDTAIEVQSTFSYVRNEVVRPLVDDAPGWAAIVEEAFPIEALADPMVFYDAGGSQERLQAHVKRMVESCESFLDMTRVDSHPMSHYKFD